VEQNQRCEAQKMKKPPLSVLPVMSTLDPTAASRPSSIINMGMKTPNNAAPKRFSVMAAAITSPKARLRYSSVVNRPMIPPHTRPLSILRQILELPRQAHGRADAALDFTRQRTEAERLNLDGLRQKEDIFASVWASARSRQAWLAINLVTACVASRVISVFEGTMEKWSRSPR
jgi:hypothetical protein